MGDLDTNIKFSDTTNDDDLVVQIENWIKESQPYHDYLLQQQKITYQYYIGNQTDKNFLQEHECDTVENRVFEAVETMVPIVTSAAHHFTCMPASNNEQSVLSADSHQKVLDIKYRTEEIQRKLEETCRHVLLYRFGVMEWGWNYIHDDLEAKVIDPRLVLVPKLRCDPYELPYKIILEEYTPEEIEDYFPEFKDFESIATYQSKIDKDEGRTESKKTFQVFKVWTKDCLCYYCNGKIINKKQNPYYDFENPQNNYFDEPRDPLVFFSTFNVGDEPFGSISLIEAVIPVQDEINTQKRQIIQNLKIMGNGQKLMDKSAMSKEEAESITNEAGLIIMGEDLVSGNKFRTEPATPLPAAHFSNLMDSKSAFDNIVGLHSASRGAANSPTLGQDMINRQQDLTRIDEVTRVINRGVQRLAEGFTQLMKMFYTETHVFRYLGNDGAVEFVKLNSAGIEAGVEIIVKAGRSPEYDRQQMGTIAVQLWQLGALSPGDLYRLLELPNPEQLEQNLMAWKTGQLSQETQSKIMQAMAGKAGGQVASSGQQQQRGIETPQNVVQRSQQQLGGSAPIGATTNEAKRYGEK